MARRLGRYDLVMQIGRGGMAEVHLAVQRGVGGFEKLVVVKLIHEELARQPAFVEMLLDEARLAAMIKHPNVVDIYDVGEVDGRHYIAMEYLEGEPLLAVLREGTEGARLDAWSTARVIADAAEGLDAAHRLKSRDGTPLELVHHDVSLGNIVVLHGGGVKLVDFGVAKAAQASAAKVHGKVAYMAPEKLAGGAVDRRSDVWSLGVVAYEALTLRRLFDDDAPEAVQTQAIVPPSQVATDVHADLDPVLLKALAREPAERYQTAKELADALEAVLRTHGYPSKNDRIATYMAAQFGGKLAARAEIVNDLLAAGIEVAPTQRRLPRWVAYAAGPLVMLVLLVLATRDEPATVAIVPVDTSVPMTIIPDAAPPADAAAELPDAPAPEPAPDIEMPIETVEDPAPRTRARPAGKLDAPTLVRRGHARLRANDARGALALFEQARQLEPNHAPVWRGLGAAYEKQGERGQAKAAYLRYLSIAPGASDAAKLRARLEKL